MKIRKEKRHTRLKAKKLFAMLVCACMVGTSMPTAVFAESGIATYSTELSTIEKEDGKIYYQIFDEDDLYAFAEMVNNDDESNTLYNAVLEADITVNSDVLADGSLNTNKTFKAWTPIGTGGTSSEQTAYGGTFDGQGHTISGLYYKGSESYVGFFGAINCYAHIKNLGIADSYFESSKSNVGGLAGKAYCSSDEATMIEDCFSIATVKGKSEVGVFCGHSEATTIRNSYAIGNYSGESNSDAFFGLHYRPADGDCYALELNTSKQGLQSGVNYCDMSVFKSGEAAYGLDYGRGRWGQKIGTDSLPKRGGEKVYYGNGTYHNHDSSNNYCVYCGAMAANSNDIYEIKTMDNLYWFANLVNTGTTSAKAILKQNITVTGNWTAIGNNGEFTGSFDGANHKVSISGGSLFGSIGSDGTVTKLGVSGGSLCSGTNGGSINGCYVSDSTAAVKLCNENTGTITSSYAAGGSGTVICGSGSGTVKNCCTLAGSTAAAADGADFTTSAPFSSGEATYRLNGSKSDGSLIWGQTIGTDTMPLLGGEGVYLKDDYYHNHNGYCTICNSIPKYDAAKGGWQIGTEDELYWFAKFVNGEVNLNDGTEYTQNAVLTADIKVNEKVLEENGNPIENVETLTKWIPIGLYRTSSSGHIDKPFKGTFDGQNHTISGLYAIKEVYNEEYLKDNIGLFGKNEGTIKNVKVYDSLFWDASNIGAICGMNSSGTIENCHTEFTLSTGSYSVGGICGNNYGGVIKNCSNAAWVGRFDADSNHGGVSIDELGGICGFNSDGTISECINTGTVGTNKGDMNYTGGIVGRNYSALKSTHLSVIKNCINAGTVAGSNNVGGICGQNCADIYGEEWPLEFGGLIWNCFSIGTVSGETYTGGICGENAAFFSVSDSIKEAEYYKNNLYGGRIFDCAYETGKVTVNGTQTDIAVGLNSRDDDRKEAVISEVFAVTAAELASGKTAYQLCETKSKKELIFGQCYYDIEPFNLLDGDTFKWKQNIDTGIADAYPKFTGAEVYKTAEASECQGYTNNSNGMREHSEGTDHKCKWCGEILTIPVTVSGIKADAKNYDGTVAATLNFDDVTISGAESGAKLSVNAVGTFDNANAGENKTVTITGITLTGEDADKYSPAETGQQTSTKASIRKKAVTAVVTVSDKDYDGNTSATVSASVNASDICAGDSITITGIAGSFNDENVGDDKTVTLTSTGVTVSGSGADNYEISLPQTAKGNIKALTAFAPTFADKEEVYTGKPIKHEISGAHSGIKSIEYSYVGKGDTEYTASENAPTAVGAYTVTASFEMEKGYKQLEPISSTLTVKKAEQSITAENVSGIYGDTDKAVIASGIGILSYTVSDGTDVAEIDSATGKLSFKKSGTATVTVSAEGDSNHKQSTKNVTISVSKKAITIKAKDKRLPQNSQAPDLSSPVLNTDYEIIGMLEGDELSSLLTLALSCEPDMSKTGDYEIILTASGTDERYELGTENGTLNVYKKSSGGGAATPVVPKVDEVTGDKTDADTETTEQAQAERLAKVKELLDKITLTARSEKTAKKNIKVTLKSDAQSDAAIKELKGLGYTVKYRFYRSTKKSSGYKAMLTKTSKNYVNTSGVKATKYYYKVQLRVYDENGKCVAKTALKQCKYACRTFGL